MPEINTPENIPTKQNTQEITTETPKSPKHINWTHIIIGSLFGAGLLIAGAWAVVVMGLVSFDSSDETTSGKTITPTSATPSATTSATPSSQTE